MLKKIQIKGLFDKFDYDIELKEGGLTILTGPNGYGKTTILKVIDAVASGNLALFFRLPFSEIALTQAENKIIHLENEREKLVIQSEDKEIIASKKEDIINKGTALIELFTDHTNRENKQLDLNSISNFNALLRENHRELSTSIYKEWIPSFVDVYLVPEQRLVRKPIVIDKTAITYKFFGNNPYHKIDAYSEELREKIKNILSGRSTKIGQELDASFPERLFNETGSISEQEFNERFDSTKSKQKSLSLYGLSTVDEERRVFFGKENAKALLVYLNDMEKKLAVFDDILQRLDLFSSILNRRQFVSKQIEISPEFGFRFKTEDGQELPLTALSSGEQQEVVLLYELLFRVEPDTLVLIDEPEISLHVAWQMEFLDDLLEIIELQKITVLVATHSIDIIDKHEDLIVDLWDLDTGFERSPA
uniref:Predicted ATP-binding protein involved in virulence n=1 Tax=Candidatus Kentrum sp. LPFa TaxID=2126335 RepID=A0A450W180_9GAMM|nr:MAG: Predicted ATP-binding protein involved in virulence [Candidatus Kentron sp. LPFa]